MSFGFPFILVSLVFISGLIWLIDALFFARSRKEKQKKMPIIIEYARSLFPVFLLVLGIRSFIAQPYRVPTGSLEPTILPGDFLFVSQFSYGLRLPVLNTKILSIGEPKTGDIVVFRYPGNLNINYIKRVVGTPGDHIVYKNRTIYINGKKMSQKFIKNTTDFEPPGIYGPSAVYIPSKLMEENLNGVKHYILLHTDKKAQESANYDVVVPKGMYFMMGDNRDNSADSRYFGFLPEKNIAGKALIVWLSWDGIKHRVRWGRIGNKL